MNWPMYYRHWDDFVQNWLENRAQPWDELSQAFLETDAFDFDKMPEPYLGRPDDGVEAVCLAINPGGLQPGSAQRILEEAKSYSRLGKGAWLLEAFFGENAGPNAYGLRSSAFEDGFCRKYSEYLRAFSCLGIEARQSIGTDREICGASNWYGSDRSSGRLLWLNRIYQRMVEPSKVFAPSICPFHLRVAQLGIAKLLRVGIPAAWFKEHVITSAVEAARAAEIPVVGIGEMICDFLERLGYKRRWVVNECSGFTEWPRSPDGQLVKRSYSLYIVEGVRFLVTSAPGDNNPPEDAFRDVDHILSDCIG